MRFLPMRFLPMRFLVLLGLLVPALASAQAPAAGAASTAEVADYVDVMPEIVGGLGALLDRVEYPEEAEKARLEGEVLVGFVVDAEGRVAEAEVLRGVHPLLDAAALDAVRATRFHPGRQGETPVRVRMALPIAFTLPDG